MNNSRKYRVLIIGATGTIGSGVVDALTANPGSHALQIIAGVRRQAQSDAFASRGIESVHLDLNDPDSVYLALKNIDAVFLSTGYTVDMLVQSKVVVDAAKVAGVTHMVHLGVYAAENASVPHSTWHQLIEAYIEKSGISFTHLRPNTFMNLVPWLTGDSIKNKAGTIYYYIGDKKWSWVAPSDISKVAAASLRNPELHRGKIYPLAVEAMNMNEIAALLTKIIGKPYSYVARHPDELLKKLLSGTVVEQAYARSVHINCSRIREGRLPECADVYDNIQAITGEPPTTWENYIEINRKLFEY